MNNYKLYSAKGSGANIIELLLEMAAVPYDIVELAWEDLTKSEYKAVNPLGQVPTLVLPDGTIMTESLAIGIYLSEKYQMNLTPTNNPNFLRWVVFMVASYYPTFTFGDHPENWVKNSEAAKELREKTDDARKKMILQLENNVSAGPWFLGETKSLIDIYFSFIMSWRPGSEWFELHCPKIIRIANVIRATPEFKKVAERNRD